MAHHTHITHSTHAARFLSGSGDVKLMELSGPSSTSAGKGGGWEYGCCGGPAAAAIEASGEGEAGAAGRAPSLGLAVCAESMSETVYCRVFVCVCVTPVFRVMCLCAEFRMQGA